MSASPTGHWELCGHRGAYWVRYRASNGSIVMGNSQQRYRDRADALHTIDLIERAYITWNADDQRIALDPPPLRDLTTRKPTNPQEGES